MIQLTVSQKKRLKEEIRRGIVRELYSRAMLTREQYWKLMSK